MRHLPMTHPLIITDALLFSNEDPNIRIVLAATLGYPNRNPSLAQLERATGLHRATISQVQQQLDQWNVRIVQEDLDGPIESVSVRPPRAVFDRPEHWYDRDPNSPRFNRSTRLEEVIRDYDPDHEVYASLPGPIVAKLPRGKGRSASVLRLVSLVYAREQLIRGAIQIEDDVVARKLGLWETRNGFSERPATKQVEAARKALLSPGILRVHNAGAHPCPIYVMPGATPQRPENPDEFQPEWTRRYWPDLLFGEYDGFASEAQHAELQQLGRLLGQEAAEDAIYAAGMQRGDDLEAEPVILALRAALAETEEAPISNGRSTYLERKKNLLSTEEERGKALPLPTPSTPSSADREGSTSLGPDEDGFAGDGEAQFARPSLPRRELGPDFYNLFCFADDETFSQLEAWRDHLTKKHGRGEAAELLRPVFLEHGPLGGQILDGLYRRFTDVAPNGEYDADLDIGEIKPIAD